METKYKTYPCVEVVLLAFLLSSCSYELPDSTDDTEALTQSGSLTSKLSFMDTVADKIFTGDPNATSRLGLRVLLGKDINGDGCGDMFIGAPYYKSIQGRVYIYYGGKDATFNVPDITLTGEGDNNYFGHDIEVADFNNDGYSDMAITALGHNSFQGRAYIYYGGPDFNTTADKVFNGETGTTGRFGREMAAGNINNDGCAELLVCADGLNSKKGRVYLYYGAPGTDMDTICDLTFDGQNPNDRFGRALALGKDVNGDGYGDVLIGTRFYPSGNNDGRAYLFYGGDPMDNTPELTFDDGVASDNFATDADLFDIDNDGYADIIIAARAYDGGRGRVYLYWGTDRTNMDTTPDEYFTGEDSVPLFGGENVDCGYVNNDDYGDIIIAGVNWPNSNKMGRAYLFYVNTKSEMDVACDMIFTGENPNDRFGFDGSLGDINGDNFGEVLIGARTFKNNSFRGRAYLYYGGPAEPEPTQVNKLLHQAAHAGDIDQVKLLISKGADVNGIKDDSLKTALHRAVINVHKGVAELFIDKGAHINAKDNQGRTPLWYAQDKGHTEIVELLRKHGAKD